MVGHFFLLIPKSWKSVHVWRQSDVMKHGRPENVDFQRNIGQNWFFAKKFQISEFHPVFTYKKREMVFLTCFVSFRSISWRYFSKWWLKIFSGGNHPLPPSDFDGLPYPRIRGTPGFFFIKWPQRMQKRLIRCPGSLCSAFRRNRRQTVTPTP